MTRTLLLAAVLAGSASLSQAEPLIGLWQTAPDDNGNFGHIQVAPCGAQICGTLVRSFDAGGQEIASDFTGRLIISETVAQGDGAYRGKIFAPDRGRTYGSRLVLSGDSLAVSGCVLGVCRDGGTWKRVN